jgi:hypothetical protein
MSEEQSIHRKLNGWLPGETAAEYYPRMQRERDERSKANRKAARLYRAADERQALEYVFSPLPTCPCCGATSLTTHRTIEKPEEPKPNYGVDYITRSVTCNYCGFHFRLSLERNVLE